MKSVQACPWVGEKRQENALKVKKMHDEPRRAESNSIGMDELDWVRVHVEVTPHKGQSQ